MNEERKAQMDFSFPLNMDNSRFLMAYPEKESTMTAIVKPFNPLVSFRESLRNQTTNKSIIDKFNDILRCG